jgi:UDP-N-acetylmuramoylalanine--D-glutamate ligase
LRKCGGTLLIAGKGHETTQEFISEKLPFHDASIVAEILQCAEETPMDGNLPQWKMGRNGKGRQRMKILILGEGITGMALKEFCENHGYAHEICRENAHQMDWQNVQCLVYSPGAIHSPLLLFAKKFGLPCLNDLDFAQQFYGNKTIAITGTNGKTSTTLMLCHMLRKLSMSAIATGNIGSPPIAHVDTFRSQKEMWNVCEVSSFQSQHMYQFRPHHSIWTNFAPNHLNMHGDCTKYFTAKQNLLACTKLHTFIGKSVGEFSQKLQINLADGHEIFDAQDTERNYWEESGGVLQFPHQVANFRAVECLLKKLFPAQKIDGNLLRNFTFPAHRLHRCHTFRNVSFWNDSKATNAAAVSAAVAALRPHCDCLLWISSGRSKGEDLENFREIISVVDYAITMGEMGKHFEKYFGQQRVLFFENDSSLCQWIGERLRQNASLSHAILFSPGFTSFDRFRNFEERGEWFVEKICRSFLWEKFC